MCEGPPELRGVKRSLMSTNEWFVIRCLIGNIEVSRMFSKKTAIKQERVVFKRIELTFSRGFFYLCYNKAKLLRARLHGEFQPGLKFQPG